MITTTKTARSEAERKQYFQPFEDNGRKLCGGTRRRCSNCGYAFTKGERLLLACPECGSDRRCRNPAGKQNGRCKFHGGRVKPGESAPNYQHGRRAAKLPHFPKHVQDAYAEAIKSTDMASIRQELGIVQARLRLVAQNVKDARQWRDDIVVLVGIVDANRAAASKNSQGPEAVKVAAAFDQMLAKIRDGATDDQWWDEILGLNMQSAELKVKHSQIERASGAVLSATQALDFVTVIGRAVREALLLVKSRVAVVRAALRDRDAVRGIVDNAVAAIESGGDVRENIEAAVDRVLESIPLDTVEGSFSEANEIVQGRIRSMVER